MATNVAESVTSSIYTVACFRLLVSTVGSIHTMTSTAAENPGRVQLNTGSDVIIDNISQTQRITTAAAADKVNVTDIDLLTAAYPQTLFRNVTTSDLDYYTAEDANNTSSEDAAVDYTYADDVTLSDSYKSYVDFPNSNGGGGDDDDSNKQLAFSYESSYSAAGFDDVTKNDSNSIPQQNNVKDDIDMYKSQFHGAAEFRNIDMHFTRSMGSKSMPGRAAGAVRWLEQNHVDMRIVTYVWLSLLLSVLLAVCLTFAFKHRHVASTVVQFTRTQYNRRKERWHSSVAVDLHDEANTLLGHAQV